MRTLFFALVGAGVLAVPVATAPSGFVNPCVAEYKRANRELWPVRPVPEHLDTEDLYVKRHAVFVANHTAYKRCLEAKSQGESDGEEKKARSSAATR